MFYDGINAKVFWRSIAFAIPIAVTSRSIAFEYTSVQKAELKVVGVLEVRTWGGAGVSVQVCTQGAAFEMGWSWFRVFQ